MQAVQKIILWLAFCFVCFQPSSALSTTAPENRVWKIFNAEYDAPASAAFIRYDTPGTPAAQQLAATTAGLYLSVSREML